MNAIRRIAATAVLDAAALAGCVGLAGVADAAPVTDRPGKLKGRRQWHDHRYRQALDHPRPTRRRPPCPPAPLAVRRRRPPVDRRIRTAAAVSSRSQPARPASVAYVDHPPVEQGPPSCPGAARAAAFEAEQAQQAERQQARPAPRPVKPAAPKPKGKPGLKLTCEPDANARLVGNIIVNKDCGYVGEDGKQHSRDPWIEDQLRAAGDLPVLPLPPTKPLYTDQQYEQMLKICTDTGKTRAQCLAMPAN